MTPFNLDWEGDGGLMQRRLRSEAAAGTVASPGGGLA
jgi:hypothetical protein